MVKAFFLCLAVWVSILSVALAGEKKVRQTDTTAEKSKETATLMAKKGEVEKLLGATVQEVILEDNGNFALVSVQVPFDPENLDKIEILGAQGKPLAGDKISQVLKDYENDNVGIKFRLKKRKNWEFKIRFYDDSKTVEQPE